MTSLSQEEKDELFFSTAGHVANILKRKNHDYGDSFFKIYKEFGDLSTLIRITDKIGRLESAVSGKEYKVTDETVDDVYKDIAGYCILSLVSKQRIQGGE